MVYFIGSASNDRAVTSTISNHVYGDLFTNIEGLLNESIHRSFSIYKQITGKTILNSLSGDRSLPAARRGRLKRTSPAATSGGISTGACNVHYILGSLCNIPRRYPVTKVQAGCRILTNQRSRSN